MLNFLLDVLKTVATKSSSSPGKMGAINYGPSTISGDHDHRYNTGGDRTPAQKAADAAKKKK
ncbi:hypothetical protein [Cupriavidus pauculus]|uniref:hypothetical protein n=1 Tax=Cupriavidus pauculus TaxID=82633 RepID=UPI0012482B90|nr:hypothetical protein [Cupriavidus pauculus]KAB0598074.1 hypothetical protein F7R19_25985 [Cupriavidus pauculus]UAK98477.1 hypothetical protein K8O84_10580 [Cupriavidus pauculus]